VCIDHINDGAGCGSGDGPSLGATFGDASNSSSSSSSSGGGGNDGADKNELTLPIGGDKAFPEPGKIIFVPDKNRGLRKVTGDKGNKGVYKDKGGREWKRDPSNHGGPHWDVWDPRTGDHWNVDKNGKITHYLPPPGWSPPTIHVRAPSATATVGLIGLIGVISSYWWAPFVFAL
jgi:hypothetical protein